MYTPTSSVENNAMDTLEAQIYPNPTNKAKIMRAVLFFQMKKSRTRITQLLRETGNQGKKRS